MNNTVSAYPSAQVPKSDSGTNAPMRSGTIRLPYFRTPERVDALKRQLQQWAGTRWAHAGTRPNQMRCGVTGDCLFWVHAFKAIGALPAKITIPDYRKMEAASDQMKLLRECIEATGCAQLVAQCPSAQVPENPGTDPLMHLGTDALTHCFPGDVLLLRNGQSGVHCGLVVRTHPLHFVHLSQNGFNEEPLHQAHWTVALAYVYRLVEENTGAQVTECRGTEVAENSGTDAPRHSGTGDIS